MKKEKIEAKAKDLRRLYKKGLRLKGSPGRRPKDSFFILLAADSINKEQPAEKKMSSEELSKWLEKNFPQYDPDGDCSWFQLKNLHRMKNSGPFKYMEYASNWEDIKKAQAISDKGAASLSKEIDSRTIQQQHKISTRKLKELAGFILSQHLGNKKTSDKFIFNRPDK